MHSVFSLSRDPPQAWTWASLTRASSRSMPKSDRTSARPARMSSSTGARTPPKDWLAASRKATRGQGTQTAEKNLVWRGEPVEKRPRTCARQRHHRIRRPRCRGSACRRERSRSDCANGHSRRNSRKNKRHPLDIFASRVSGLGLLADLEKIVYGVRLGAGASCHCIKIHQVGDEYWNSQVPSPPPFCYPKWIASA